MKVQNFDKLAKHAVGLAGGLAGMILAGAAVTLPAAAQVESAPVSGEPTLEAPSVDDLPTPETPELPSAETVPDAVLPDEMTEPSTDKPTAETLTPEPEAADEAVSPETDEVAPESTEATETEEVVPEATETTELETEEVAPETTEAPGIAAGSGTIVDVAAASDTFEILVAALTEAELAEVLQGEGPFTVFAPTDEAFAALPAGTVEELMKPENREMLVKILSYHVVSGSITSDQLASGDVATVEGNSVTVMVDGSTVMVNDANVIQPDIPASNGVIHAIDRVILPPDLQ